jgi:hypothetical protein
MSPFRSEKQRKWMWANEPEVAEKWSKEERRERKHPSDKSRKRQNKRKAHKRGEA